MTTCKFLLASMAMLTIAFTSCEVHRFYGPLPKQVIPYYGEFVGENDSMAVYYRNEAYIYMHKKGWKITKQSIWILNKETNKCSRVITSSMRSGLVSVEGDSILYKIPINDYYETSSHSISTHD